MNFYAGRFPQTDPATAYAKSGKKWVRCTVTRVLKRKSKKYGKGQGLPKIYRANQGVKLKIKSARSTKKQSDDSIFLVRTDGLVSFSTYTALRGRSSTCTRRYRATTNDVLQHMYICKYAVVHSCMLAVKG